MKNILLPTDFSKKSIQALACAVKLLEHHRSQFYILNVLKVCAFKTDDTSSVTSQVSMRNTLYDAAKKSITNIINDIEKQTTHSNHSFHSVIDSGNFIEVLNQSSKIYQIDIIVLGTKRAFNRDMLFLGTHTFRAIQRCHSPVLVIPSNCKIHPLDCMVFTYNFTSKTQKKIC